MTTRRHNRIALLALVVATCALVSGGSTARAEEATLIHSESGGFITLEGETLVRVSGMQGTIAVRTGKEGELRYEVRSLDDRREERPIGLWLSGRGFEIAALEETGEERLLLEMAVPPGLDVELELDDSNVQVAGLRSDLVLVGGGLDVDLRGIHGNLTIELVESEVKFDGVSGDVEIDSEALSLVATRVDGSLGVTLLDSQADIRTVSGEADVDVENTVMVLSELEAGLVLQASGGRVEVYGVKPRSEFRLDGAPLVLSGTLGEASIESDSEIQVSEAKGPVVIRGFGGPIVGKALESRVEITADQALVDLEDVKGKLTINGNDLGVKIKNIEAEAIVRTDSSEVLAEGIAGPLQIHNAYGRVEVHGAKDVVKVVNRDADVLLADVAGSVDVFATGDSVEVGWSEFPADGHHVIANERGGIVVNLPGRTRCRIEAQSKYGKISSDIASVRINEDGRFASGVVGGGRGPTIQIRSNGDVLISGDAAAPDLPTQ
jgi:hypothetical protein